MAVFVVDPIGWQTEFRGWGGVVGKWLTNKAEDVQHLAMIEAPGPGKIPHNRTGINYSTGNLQSRIRVNRGRFGVELEARVVAIPDNALWVHEGTRPHVILPGSAPRLVFFWAKVGRVVYLPKVNHPGMMANPFLERALHGVMLRT